MGVILRGNAIHVHRVPSMLKSFYVFNSNGSLLFHHDLTPEKIDAKLVSSFLSAINRWAEMYSSTGISLFMTGAVKFLFERSIYSQELIFTVAASLNHPESDLTEKIGMIRENFVHFFWEDIKDMENGEISIEKIEGFKKIAQDFLKNTV
nr:hypothetical protein [Candidatus Sigynarchaeota archaeon]